jgi:hypothetical protein
VVVVGRQEVVVGWRKVGKGDCGHVRRCTTIEPKESKCFMTHFGGPSDSFRPSLQDIGGPGGGDGAL